MYVRSASDVRIPGRKRVLDRQQRGIIGSILALVGVLSMLSVALLPAQAGPAEESRSARPRPMPRPRALIAQQRTEDRGFSLTLTSPDESYLVGQQKVAVEPVVPAGDVMERADFFIDGKLVFTDRVPPYAFQNDFGRDIRQHTILVRSRTLDGREARVSFVSRSADISDSAAGPIEVIPAVVRDARGRPVVDLKVSDFSLLENGVNRPIIHFDNDPAPISIVVALNERDLAPGDRTALLRSAAVLGDDLPHHDALSFVDGADLAEVPDAQFSHDRDVYRKQLATARRAPRPHRVSTLPDLLGAAARSIRERPGGRALLLLTGGPPPPPPAPPAPEEPRGTDQAVQAESHLASGEDPGAAPAVSADDAAQRRYEAEVAAAAALQEERLQALRSALQELQRARVTINVMLAGDVDHDAPELALLRRVTVKTGGDYLVLSEGSDPQMAFLRIAESLLHRYLISFQPGHPERGGDSVIDVRVRRPRLEVRAPTALSGEQRD